MLSLAFSPPAAARVSVQGETPFYLRGSFVSKDRWEQNGTGRMLCGFSCRSSKIATSLPPLPVCLHSADFACRVPQLLGFFREARRICQQINMLDPKALELGSGFASSWLCLLPVVGPQSSDSAVCAKWVRWDNCSTCGAGQNKGGAASEGHRTEAPAALHKPFY